MSHRLCTCTRVHANVCTSAWALESTPALEWKSPLSAIYMQIKTHPLSSTEMHSGIVSFLWPVQVKQKLLCVFVTLKHIKLPLFLSPPSKTQRVFTFLFTVWGENGQFSYLTSIAIFMYLFNSRRPTVMIWWCLLDSRLWIMEYNWRVKLFFIFVVRRYLFTLQFHIAASDWTEGKKTVKLSWISLPPFIFFSLLSRALI